MQTKTTGDAKNDKRPSPAPAKAPPVADKPYGGRTSMQCQARGCDGCLVCEPEKHSAYEYNGCREGWDGLSAKEAADLAIAQCSGGDGGIMAHRMGRDDWE